MAKRFFIFLLLAPFVLSACQEKKEISNDSWKDEVLFASECGLEGLQCCVGDEDPCLYGLECCADPNDPEMTYCAEECSFGSPNTFCRASEPRCDTGSVCFDGYCQLAGGDGQPCYNDGSCDEGVVCGDGVCVECGLPGNPCCADAEYACRDGNPSEPGRTACLDNICRECGFGGRTVCPQEPYCNKGHLNNNDKCLACGAYNQACCRDDEGGFYCNEDLVCASGFCGD